MSRSWESSAILPNFAPNFPPDSHPFNTAPDNLGPGMRPVHLPHEIHLLRWPEAAQGQNGQSHHGHSEGPRSTCHDWAKVRRKGPKRWCQWEMQMQISDAECCLCYDGALSRADLPPEPTRRRRAMLASTCFNTFQPCDKSYHACASSTVYS